MQQVQRESVASQAVPDAELEEVPERVAKITEKEETHDEAEVEETRVGVCQGVRC